MTCQALIPCYTRSLTSRHKAGMMRVIRAFFQALWLTLQGRPYVPPVPVQPYPPLEAWRVEGLQRVGNVFRAADTQGLTLAVRQAHTLTLEGRPISLETIVRAVEHNLLREYPLLMTTRLEHTLTVLYALNLNDHYRVQQLAGSLEAGVVRVAVQALADHLEAIPPASG